jgi:hypothetical protein
MSAPSRYEITCCECRWSTQITLSRAEASHVALGKGRCRECRSWRLSVVDLNANTNDDQGVVDLSTKGGAR